MWTGRRFRLNSRILAIGIEGTERVAYHIPAEEIVQVVYGPRPDSGRLVDIHWKGQLLSVFTADLETRAEDITPTGEA